MSTAVEIVLHILGTVFVLQRMLEYIYYFRNLSSKAIRTSRIINNRKTKGAVGNAPFSRKKFIFTYLIAPTSCNISYGIPTTTKQQQRDVEGPHESDTFCVPLNR